MSRFKEIDCFFCQASHCSQMITEERFSGDCLEDIGIVVPNGGIAVVDRTIFPRVGDLVICCMRVGSLKEFIKQVFSIGNEIIVGTHYKDKSRDFSFKAEEIRGVVRYVMDDKRNVLWECERLKEQEENNAELTPLLYVSRDFTRRGNTVQLAESKCFDNGASSTKTLKVKHKPLERCPHCGGAAEIEFVNEFGSTRSGFITKCKKCGCSSAPIYEGETLSLQRGKPTYGYFSFADALNYVVDKWNTRYEVTANA